jgi:hypothetical protein
MGPPLDEPSRELRLMIACRERVALAEQKYEHALKENEGLKQRLAVLEDENARLRAQIIPHEAEITFWGLTPEGRRYVVERKLI